MFAFKSAAEQMPSIFMTNGVEPGGALGLENAYDATTDGTYGTYRTNGMDPGHISPMSPIGPIRS